MSNILEEKIRDEKILREFEQVLVSEMPYEQAVQWLEKQLLDYTKQVISEALVKDLKVVLDFVERWNKQDSEKNVAQSAEDIKQNLKEQGIIIE